MVWGRPWFTVLTSVAGQPNVAWGSRLERLGPAAPVRFKDHPGDGVWMESVIADEGGTWYGYYHNEVPAITCNRLDRSLPRVGAARSRNRGRTWENLGIILEAPAGWEACGTPNAYFVGGVGDVNAVLDAAKTELYVFFSQYSRPPSAQGVAVARMPWAERDAPVGRLDVWVDGVWMPPAAQEAAGPDDEVVTRLTYPTGTPLVRVDRPWHDADVRNDAFWGPSIHWNTHLNQYVALLNRTSDERFTQEGVYVSFAPRLDDPRLWSPPQRILRGGSWYPQVMGLEVGEGSDKQAGATARFFMHGISDYLITFDRGT